MASNQTSLQNSTSTPTPIPDIEQQTTLESEKKDFDYSTRAQWLRAAVLGANDGLVSISALMMGVGAVKQDVKAMILIGFAGVVAGACSMAIGEYVSVYSQLEIELAQERRDKKTVGDGDSGGSTGGNGGENKEEEKDEGRPSPGKAAAASAIAFTTGGIVPLLGASFIRNYKVRVGVVVGVVSVALVVFAWLGAALGKAPLARSIMRVLIGGWLAMAITFGLIKLVGSGGL
ncbi:vacuolar iron transporter homolog 4-like [Camellia sinensis]|uniref:Vacuolar iron transporter n=1 Tax=Camellia sinensis var. sinensis TaxID=542762 RepID=A0A4S4EDB1_CAMSN|nr:vacuolar iron transporter homolog 4-like [Camellia sinensis]THG14313.1 hypothetical protein TEA_002676 [Camellia sinensis var. sinensis]